MSISIIIHESAFYRDDNHVLLDQLQIFGDQSVHICFATDSDGSDIPVFKSDLKKIGYRFDDVFHSNIVNGLVTYQENIKYVNHLNKASKQLGKPLPAMVLVNCSIPQDKVQELQEKKMVTIVQADDETPIDVFIINLQTAYQTACTNAATYKLV